MANYVNLAELKTVLGVGDLYPDAQLTSVSTAATNLILSMLSRFQYPVDQLCCEDGNIVKARTLGFHKLFVGQTIVLEGLPAHLNGPATVTEIGYTAQQPIPPLWPWPTFWPYSYLPVQTELYNTFKFQKTHGEPPITVERAVIPYGFVTDQASEDVYSTDPLVTEACIMLAVEIWQSRVAPGGTIQGVDFQPGPFRLGRSLIGRVQGLLAPHMDVGTMVG
jgi:hypothetical protein